MPETQGPGGAWWGWDQGTNNLKARFDSNFQLLDRIAAQSVSAFKYMSASQITDVVTRTGAVDVSAALQSALNELTTKGGVLVIPPGVYRIGTSLTFTRSPLGCAIYAEGAQFVYQNTTGWCLKFSNTGVSSTHHLPYVVLRGLNILYKDAVAVSGNEGLVLENMLSSYIENVKINGFGDNYVMRNVTELAGGIWSENNMLVHCASRVPFRANFRFSRSGSSTPLDSFARTAIISPFVNSNVNSAGQGTIGFQIDPGCSYYDSVIKDVSGNCSGDAMFWIRSNGSSHGNMEGSTIDGLRWEHAGKNRLWPGDPTPGTAYEGPIVAFLLDRPDVVKLPNVVNRGNYCFGLAATRMRIWGDNSGSTPGTTDNIVPILRPSTPHFHNHRHMSPVYTPEGSYAELGFVAHQAVFIGQTFEDMVQDQWYSLNEPTWGRPFNADHGTFLIQVELMEDDGVSGIQSSTTGFKGSYIITRAATQAGTAQVTVLSETPRTEKIELEWPQSTFSPAYRGVPQIRVTGGSVNRGARITITSHGSW